MLPLVGSTLVITNSSSLLLLSLLVCRPSPWSAQLHQQSIVRSTARHSDYTLCSHINTSMSSSDAHPKYVSHSTIMAHGQTELLCARAPVDALPQRY